MAARKTKHLSDDWRSKIQTSMLLNRLHGLVNGENEMPPHAVSAAIALLRKNLPDLSNVTLSGDKDNPVIHRIERHVVSHSKD